MNEIDRLCFGQWLGGDHLEGLSLEGGVEDNLFAGELDVKGNDRLDRCVGEVDLDGGVAANGGLRRTGRRTACSARGWSVW
jgi:hypothetical protein